MNFLKKSLLLTIPLFMISHSAFTMMEEETPPNQVSRRIPQGIETAKEVFYFHLITAKTPEEVPFIGKMEKGLLQEDRAFLRVALWNHSYQGRSQVFKELLRSSTDLLTAEDVRASFLMAAHGGEEKHTSQNDIILQTILSVGSLNLPRAYFEMVSRKGKDKEGNILSRFNHIKTFTQQDAKYSFPHPDDLQDDPMKDFYTAALEGKVDTVRSIFANRDSEMSREILENALYKAASNSREAVVSYLLSETIPEEVRPQISEVNAMFLYARIFENTAKTMEEEEKYRSMKDLLLSDNLPIQPSSTCIRVMQALTRSVLSLPSE